MSLSESVWSTFRPQKVTGTLEVAFTFFMTPEVTVTLTVGSIYIMSQKCHGDIRGRLTLFISPEVKVNLEVDLNLFMTLKGQADL